MLENELERSRVPHNELKNIVINETLDKYKIMHRCQNLEIKSLKICKAKLSIEVET